MIGSKLRLNNVLYFLSYVTTVAWPRSQWVTTRRRLLRSRPCRRSRSQFESFETFENHGYVELRSTRGSVGNPTSSLGKDLLSRGGSFTDCVAGRGGYWKHGVVTKARRDAICLIQTPTWWVKPTRLQYNRIISHEFLSFANFLVLTEVKLARNDYVTTYWMSTSWKGAQITSNQSTTNGLFVGDNMKN